MVKPGSLFEVNRTALTMRRPPPLFVSVMVTGLGGGGLAVQSTEDGLITAMGDGVWVMVTDPLAPVFASTALTLQVAGVVEATYTKLAWP
jgi:hypothetical protein